MTGECVRLKRRCDFQRAEYWEGKYHERSCDYYKLQIAVADLMRLTGPYSKAIPDPDNPNGILLPDHDYKEGCKCPHCVREESLAAIWADLHDMAGDRDD